MILIALIFSVLANAEVEKSQNDILAMTGLTEKYILTETQKSLEEYLFQDGSGISCGLDEFYVSHYTVPSPSQTLSYDKFTIATETTGPVGYCDGYARYMCFVEWSNKSGVWKTVSTDCEDGYEFND